MKHIILAIVLVAVGCGSKETDNNATTNNATTQTTANNVTPNNVAPNNVTPNNQTPNNQTTTTNNTTNTNQMTNMGNPLMCDANFGSVPACGGNPVGTWQYTEVCDTPNLAGPITGTCPNAQVVATQLDFLGTLTITADTFTQALDGTATLSVDLPNGCEFMDCDLAAVTLETIPDVSDAACADLGVDGCACTVTMPHGDTSQGTYTVNAGQLTLGTGETYHFCSRDGTMLTRRFGTPNDGWYPAYLYTAQ